MSAPSQWFSKRRGIATGLAVSGSGLGGLAMSLVSQELLSHVGFAWTMRINAMFSFGSTNNIIIIIFYILILLLFSYISLALCHRSFSKD